MMMNTVQGPPLRSNALFYQRKSLCNKNAHPVNVWVHRGDYQQARHLMAPLDKKKKAH